MSLYICLYVSCTESMKMKIYIGIYTEYFQEYDISFPSIHGKPCFALIIKTDNYKHKLVDNVENNKGNFVYYTSSLTQLHYLFY